MTGCWMWAMSFPRWGNGEVAWEDARGVYDESGRLVGVVPVDCEAPDD